MKSLKRRPGPASGKELGLDEETLKRHQKLTLEFTQLYRELEKEGMFKPSPGHIAYRLVEVIALALVGCSLISCDSLVYRILGIISFGLFEGRSSSLQHEGGHYSFVGNCKIDRFLQAIIFGFGFGLSSSWWTSQHNRHHAMPQRIKRDVDLETLPLLAFNAKLVRNPKQGKSFFIRNQSKLFLLIDTLLVGFLWKFYLNPRHVWRNRKYMELFFIGLHNCFIYYLGVIPYVCSSWVATVYLLGNFALNHSHLPVNEGPLHWVEYSLLHTMDIDSSWYVDWWMCFLNYQVEHHLFPAIPQFRLWRIRERVRALAERNKIPFYCTSYSEAVYKTFTNLKSVSENLRQD